MGAARQETRPPHRMCRSNTHEPDTDLIPLEPSPPEREAATMPDFGERGGLLSTPGRHCEKPESATVERFDTVAGS